MTAVENYAVLINNIFGPNTSTFDISKTHTNNVIGALNNVQLTHFTDNFIARLHRLKNIYENHPEYYKDIIVQINEIQSPKNWEGAFAELATYDHFHDNSANYLFEPIKPNITFSNKMSFAEKLGKQETNLDGAIENLSIYFDVKCLKDNVTEILEGLYLALKTHLGSPNIHLSAEHAMDVAYNEFQHKRAELLCELKQEITNQNKATFLQSKVISGLNFRIMWNGGVQTTIKTYDPYLHAQNFHKSIFNYTNKFLKTKPTLIVLVIFPWYNHVVTDFGGSNIEFFRSLARRVFCQYRYDETKFKSFNPAFKGDETIFDVSNYLSGIVILEDKTILGKNKDSTNVESYVFLNPNAKNPIRHSMATGYLNTICSVRYDDFNSDNY